jgi:hypothetical protein
VTCPSRGLENAPSAQHCECGYNFEQGEPLKPAKRNVRIPERAVLSLILSGAIVLIGSTVGTIGGWGWNSVVAIWVLLPGMALCQPFMSTYFATPTVRLVILAVVSALVYWPLLWLLIGPFEDRKRLNR